MNDIDCVEFLQWALPRLRMRWVGFRKVRGQVCKRLGRRLRDLGITDSLAYRDYLEGHPEEWQLLDGYCRITISRFHRDRRVFQYLGDYILPELSKSAAEAGVIHCWSAGCASGEEPFTLALMWHLHHWNDQRDIDLEITATDAEPKVLERAHQGYFARSSFRELPEQLLESAFTKEGDGFHLLPEYRERVRFELQDIRHQMPEGPFQFILCRNLVFTYFEEDLQRELLDKMLVRLAGNGVLVLGGHESLPEGDWPLEPCTGRLPIFRRV